MAESGNRAVLLFTTVYIQVLKKYPCCTPYWSAKYSLLLKQAQDALGLKCFAIKKQSSSSTQIQLKQAVSEKLSMARQKMMKYPLWLQVWIRVFARTRSFCFIDTRLKISCFAVD
ncbi:hypothetical protein O9929_07815 [Vibrio lentus]|nr:hypothetical protein [Vibrio lentus]